MSLPTPRVPHARRYSIPGSVMMKLELGEAPPRIASMLDVRGGHAEAVARTGLAAVDRVLHRFSDQVQIARVHASAKRHQQPGRRHTDFDDVEHCVGLSRTFRIRIDPVSPVTDVVDALRQLNEVEVAGADYLVATPFIQPIAPGRPDDPDASRHVINAALAQGYEPGHPSVSIAVLDTGISRARTGFNGSVLRGLDTVELGHRDLAAGLELLGDNSGVDTAPDDDVGHGTACAGIIAGNGEHGPPGLAANCTLLPVRVLGSVRVPGKDRTMGVGSPLDIDAGMKRAIDLNAKVLNLSFGTALADLDPGDPVPHVDLVRYGAARGCVMIAASGNSGHEEKYSPAALPEVIAVGAVNDDRTPAHFSTRGEHVALCAPGSRVVGTGLDGKPVRVTGTSFAAPFVTATAALLVSRSLRRSQPLNAEDVRRLLQQTAQPWAPNSGEGLGAGILDAAAALRALDQRIDLAAESAALSHSAGIREGPVAREKVPM